MIMYRLNDYIRNVQAIAWKGLLHNQRVPVRIIDKIPFKSKGKRS